MSWKRPVFLSAQVLACFMLGQALGKKVGERFCKRSALSQAKKNSLTSSKTKIEILSEEPPMYSVQFEFIKDRDSGKTVVSATDIEFDPILLLKFGKNTGSMSMTVNSDDPHIFAITEEIQWVTSMEYLARIDPKTLAFSFLTMVITSIVLSETLKWFYSIDGATAFFAWFAGIWTTAAQQFNTNWYEKLVVHNEAKVTVDRDFVAPTNPDPVINPVSTGLISFGAPQSTVQPVTQHQWKPAAQAIIQPAPAATIAVGATHEAPIFQSEGEMRPKPAPVIYSQPQPAGATMNLPPGVTPEMAQAALAQYLAASASQPGGSVGYGMAAQPGGYAATPAYQSPPVGEGYGMSTHEAPVASASYDQDEAPPAYGEFE